MEQTPTDQAMALQPGLASKVEGLLARKPVIMQLLRFAAIGVLNTALDFVVLNFVSKTLNISSGFRLGQINIIGFTLAVIQSYFWNKHWAFSQAQALSLWKNFTRLVLVGTLGALAVIFVLLGSSAAARPIFYLIMLAVFLIAQVALWMGFGLSKARLDSIAPVAGTTAGGNKVLGLSREFWLFVIVSVIGLAINSAVLSLISSKVALVANSDLNKNIAKILATFFSLVWNFIGYKIFVFKR